MQMQVILQALTRMLIREVPTKKARLDLGRDTKYFSLSADKS
jgi:hypothetical protein